MYEPRFALCLKIGTAEDLHLHTVYRVLPDEKAAEADYLRIIDESGEDYLYQADYFVLLDLPPHEVAHLQQMNHSPAFWKIVATLVDDYAARRAALRRDVHRYLLL